MACTEPVPTPSSSARSRPRISPAARGVNVTASTWPGGDVTGRHQVRDAAGDGAGLAGPGTGQHAHRTARRQHRLALLVVKVADESRRNRCVRASTGMASIMAGRTDNARAGIASRALEQVRRARIR